MGFNKLKCLLYVVSGMNVFNQLNCFFHQLISLKSSDNNRMCEKFNQLISHKPDYISCVFESKGTIMHFFSAKTCHSSPKNSFFALHNCKVKIEDLG